MADEPTSATSPTWWTQVGDAIVVTLRVTPGGKRSELIDASGEELRVRVAAPAIEGKANAELQRLLGQLFGVRRAAVVVVRGERSRHKAVRIEGLAAPPASLLAEE